MRLGEDMRLSNIVLVGAAILVGGTAAIVSATSLSAAELSAHHRRLHRHVKIVPPGADAIELAGIAPPARRGTVLQTYGDAAIARSHLQQRYPSEERHDAVEAAQRGTPYPCDPRVATADAYVCRNEPTVLGYGQGYAFTPSYVSSPAEVGDDPRTQTPVMPAITGFFWAVNSARFDPH